MNQLGSFSKGLEGLVAQLKASEASVEVGVELASPPSRFGVSLPDLADIQVIARPNEAGLLGG